MRMHEVKLKPDAAPRYKGQTILYGALSRWDVKNECFYLLPQKQGPKLPGNLGRDGIRIAFADCLGVYQESDRPGVYDRKNLIPEAVEHYRKNRF